MAAAVPARRIRISSATGAAASAALISATVATGRIGLLLGDHHRDRDRRGVGERDVPARHPAAPGERRRPRRDAQRRGPPVRAHDLDVVPREGPDAATECLHGRLLGGEARGEALNVSGRLGALPVGEQARGDRRVSPERGAEARDVDGVDPHAGDQGHSTVTVLARLRGRSTSLPSLRASEYASSWSGTTSTTGARTGSGAFGIRSTWRASPSPRATESASAPGSPLAPSSSLSASGARTTTVAPRAAASATFDNIFSRRGSSTATTTVPGSISASGPCLSSPAG